MSPERIGQIARANLAPGWHLSQMEINVTKAINAALHEQRTGLIEWLKQQPDIQTALSAMEGE